MLILGSITRLMLPLRFFILLIWILSSSIVNAFLNFKYSTLSVSFKKFSMILSPFSYGIVRILFRKLSRTIMRRTKWGSSNFLKVPFLAIGGIWLTIDLPADLDGVSREFHATTRNRCTFSVRSSLDSECWQYRWHKFVGTYLLKLFRILRFRPEHRDWTICSALVFDRESIEKISTLSSFCRYCCIRRILRWTRLPPFYSAFSIQCLLIEVVPVLILEPVFTILVLVELELALSNFWELAFLPLSWWEPACRKEQPPYQ